VKAFVGVTDWDWFELLRRQTGLDEVNFWQPSGSRLFRALQPGELFLFKLHSPRNYIAGGGIFAHSSLLPISLAWETFGIANGAVDFSQMRDRVEYYRKRGQNRLADYTIGCILLE
jgi:putative restriction endonuclease